VLSKKKPIIVYIIGIFFIIYPFIVSPIYIKLEGSGSYLLPNGSWTDIFMLCKERLLFVFSTFISFCFLCGRILADKPVKSLILDKKSYPLLIFSGAYLFLVIISAIFSVNKTVCFWGFPTENEGVAAVIGYLAVFFMTYNYFCVEKHRKILYDCLFALIVLIISATLVEYYIISLPNLIYPEHFELDGRVSLTFGNPTIFGSFCALLFPFSVLYSLKENRKVVSVIKGFVPWLLAFFVIASGSSAAFYGFCIAFFISMILLIVKIKPPIKSVVAFAYGIPLIIILIILNPGKFTGNLNSVAFNKGVYQVKSDYFHLKEVSLIDDGILIINNENQSFVIPKNINEAEKFTENSEINTIDYSWADDSLIIDFGYNSPVQFRFINNEIYYVGLNGSLEDILDTPAFPQFEKYYKLATGRGYIWLNTLPILKECIIIGKGMGNYPFSYPHNEIAGQLNTHGTANILTDKPHNMYLQTAVNNGLTALLFFMIFVFLALKSGIKSMFSKQSDILSYAFPVSCSVYLIMGMANDSAVSLAPFFWLMLGLSASQADN